MELVSIIVFAQYLYDHENNVCMSLGACFVTFYCKQQPYRTRMSNGRIPYKNGWGHRGLQREFVSVYHVFSNMSSAAPLWRSYQR